MFENRNLNSKIIKFTFSLIGGLIASILITSYLVTSQIPSLSTKNLATSVTVATNYTTSWIGNTFGGNNKWVQIRVSGMYIAPDGTVYTNSGWDEAGREAGIYKNGDTIGKAEDLHGWGRSGGAAVVADQKYIYIAMQQGHVANQPANQDYPPDKINWNCVRRYEIKGKPAPFPGGRGWDKSMLIVSDKNEVTGLAILGNELFVSQKGGNKVTVYNKNTLKPLRNFAVPSPGQLTADRKGTLWVIQNQDGGKSGKVLHYSSSGKQLPEAIGDVVKPSAVALDIKGRLLVADNAERYSGILIYNIANKPTQVGTFGEKGGVYAGVKGEIKDLKFYGISGIGCDRNGNIYVANNGFNDSGVDLRKFSTTGKLEWQLLGLHFIDNADVDPATDGLSIFTKQERFAMDYNKPPGKQWSYKGYTLNPFKYPQDPRLHTASDATKIARIKGKPFMFLMDMYGGTLQIYRFNKATDGEVAIPSGLFVGSRGDDKAAYEGNWIPSQPPSGEWIWRDKNGNGKFERSEYDRSKDYPYIGGWWVDSNGDIWKSLRTQDGKGIRHYPFQGFDSYGNPIYSYSKMEKQTHPSIFTDMRRIEYFPATDTMYLSGFTKDHPAINQDYSKLIGSEIARIDNWSKGNRTPRFRIVLPTDSSSPPEVLTPIAMSVAGDYVFVTTVKTWEVHAYSTTTGKLVRTLKPNGAVSGELGWVDIAYGIRAYRRTNGEYLVFVEEDFKGKVVMYQMK